MKKIISGIVCMLLVLSVFTSCADNSGQNNSDPSESGKSDTTASSTPSSTENTGTTDKDESSFFYILINQKFYMSGFKGENAKELTPPTELKKVPIVYKDIPYAVMDNKIYKFDADLQNPVLMLEDAGSSHTLMAVQDDKIYFSSTKDSGTMLECIDLNGQNRKELNNLSASAITIGKDCFYYKTEEANTELKIIERALWRVPFDGGEKGKVDISSGFVDYFLENDLLYFSYYPDPLKKDLRFCTMKPDGTGKEDWENDISADSKMPFGGNFAQFYKGIYYIVSAKTIYTRDKQDVHTYDGIGTPSQIITIANDRIVLNAYEEKKVYSCNLKGGDLKVLFDFTK